MNSEQKHLLVGALIAGLFVLVFPPYRANGVDLGFGFLFAPPFPDRSLGEQLDLPRLGLELAAVIALAGLAFFLTRTRPAAAGNARDADARRSPRVQAAPLRRGRTASDRPRYGLHWLHLWCYLVLPLAGLFVAIVAAGLYPRHPLLGGSLFLVAFGLWILAVGLHFRQTWAWQWNWLLIAIPWLAPPPSASEVSFLDLMIKTSVFSALLGVVWILPNYQYWNRRAALFLEGRNEAARLALVRPTLGSLALTYLILSLVLAIPRSHRGWFDLYLLAPERPPPRLEKPAATVPLAGPAGPGPVSGSPGQTRTPAAARQRRDGAAGTVAPPVPAAPGVEAAVLEAVRRGDLAGLDRYLESHDVNRPIGGSTLLIEAVKAGQIPSVARLLERGADPRLTDAGGRGPYLYAQMRGEPELLRLLEGGAWSEPLSPPPGEQAWRPRPRGQGRSRLLQ